VAKIINAALGLLGLVAVVIILIGGFKWMTAMGNEDNVKKARQLILEGVIGLIIIVCAYAIAQFVISAIQSATS
jgi:TRAP-type C4-dicarboxylate transport system permease small subunit